MVYTREDIISALKARKTELNEQLKQMELDSNSERTESEWREFDESFDSLKYELEEVNKLLRYYTGGEQNGR